MMSEGKSISSDFLRLARISELMSQGFLCAHFGGLEQPWEPINPGCPCPRQGKTSSSDTELGWAELSQAQALPGLLQSAGVQIQAPSPVGILHPCGTGMGMWSFPQPGLSLQEIPAALKECCGTEGESPTLCPGQLHPEQRQPLVSGSRTSLLGS